MNLQKLSNTISNFTISTPTRNTYVPICHPIFSLKSLSFSSECKVRNTIIKLLSFFSLHPQTETEIDNSSKRNRNRQTLRQEHKQTNLRKDTETETDIDSLI